MLEAKEAVKVIKISDVIRSVEVMEATEVFRTIHILKIIDIMQCWTEGRRSTAVAEVLRPTATATVAEV